MDDPALFMPHLEFTQNLGLTLLSWAETFDAASRETQRSIIAMLIDRIVVYSDYRLDIHFRITVQQYLGKAS